MFDDFQAAAEHLHAQGYSSPATTTIQVSTTWFCTWYMDWHIIGQLMDHKAITFQRPACQLLHAAGMRQACARSRCACRILLKMPLSIQMVAYAAGWVEWRPAGGGVR